MDSVFEAKEALLKKLGWLENPFVKDLRVFDRESFLKYYCPFEADLILEKLAFDIKALLLVGPKGVGKTSAMYYVYYLLPGKEFTPVFFKEPPKDLNALAEEAGFSRKGFFGKLFGWGGKREWKRQELAERLKSVSGKLAFFVDEAHLGSEEMFMEFKYLLDEVPNLRIVFSALGKEPFPDSLLQLIGEPNVFQRSSFSSEEMTEIILHRVKAVGGRAHEPFSPKFLEGVFTEQNLLTPRYLFDELNAYLAQLASGKAKPEQGLKEDLLVQAAIRDAQLVAEKRAVTKDNVMWWTLLSPSQQKMMDLLVKNSGGLTLREIMDSTGFPENTAFNALYQLRGDDLAEKKRKPQVPFPLISVRQKLVGARKRNLYVINSKIRNLFTMH